MLYRYYMPFRPASPGAQPRAGLEMVEDRDFDDVLPDLNHGVYAVITYSRELTDAELNDYELVPVDFPEPITYNGYIIKYLPFTREYAIVEPDRPHDVLAVKKTAEKCQALIDHA